VSPIPFTRPEGELAAEFFTTTIAQLSAANLPDRLLEDSGADFPDQVWKDAAESGWFRLLLAEEHDGLGLGYGELGAIFRAVGHRPLRGPLLDHAVALPLLAAAAPPDLRAELLPALDGERVAVMVEPLGVPYGDPADLRLEDGVLSGSAGLVAFAAAADAFVVVADRGGDPVLALLAADGVAVEPLPSQDPTMEVARVTFDRVPVPDGRLLATGSDAAALIATIHGGQRLMAVAELSGAAEEMTALSVDYAKERFQFGRPIAGFQALRHILSAMTGKSSALISISDAALEDVDEDPARVAERGRLAKAYSAEPSRFIAEQALQVHGGVGFTQELSLHLYIRRVLSLQGFLGEDAELFTEIGAAALEAA
jgi:alkylation response protein AidB-like acyl-CoA dehydrogenase